MEDEINLIDYWRIFLKRKWSMAIIVFVGTVFFLLYSLTLPKIYQAEATIIPVGGQGGGETASMIAASMGLSGLLGSFGGRSSTSAQLLTILKSRTLAEKMIEKYGLMKIFYPDLWDEKEQRIKIDDSLKMPPMEDAVKNLHFMVSSYEDKKNQLIIIKTTNKNPEVAAKITNDYITELATYINENTFTSAKRNRLFVEGQLERNKMDLLESGKEMTTFYSTNRVSNVVPAVDVDVSMGTGNHAPDLPQLTLNPPAVSAVSLAWTEAKKKSDELKKQMENVKTEIEKTKIVSGVPQQIYLQYLILRRALLEQVNGLLSQQYEMAKIEEAKEDLNFQVIDWARVPVHKFKPQRRQIVMLGFMLSGLLALFYAGFKEYLEKLKK